MSVGTILYLMLKQEPVDHFHLLRLKGFLCSWTLFYNEPLKLTGSHFGSSFNFIIQIEMCVFQILAVKDVPAALSNICFVKIGM